MTVCSGFRSLNHHALTEASEVNGHLSVGMQSKNCAQLRSNW